MLKQRVIHYLRRLTLDKFKQFLTDALGYDYYDDFSEPGFSVFKKFYDDANKTDNAKDKEIEALRCAHLEMHNKINDLLIINDNLSSSNRQIAELLDANDKALDALREYANLCIQSGTRLISAEAYGLIDESGNLTPLLTGKK